MSGGHRARKRFGQNFLHDRGVIDRIVSAIRPQADDCLVEIGPGQGALTRPLLERLDTLHVVELDRDLTPALRELAPGRLIVHEADALRFDFSALAPAPGALRVVGNLPYNISTPLLFHLLTQRASLRDMHFMLQKEVVERMGAAADADDYGRLSVMTQYYCQVTPLFVVGPGAFKPAPKVHSAVVRLVPHASPPVAVGDEAVFADVVARAFAQRRKTVRNALKLLLDTDGLVAAGVDPGTRPETLDLSAFAALSRQVCAGRRSAAGGGAGHDGAELG